MNLKIAWSVLTRSLSVLASLLQKSTAATKKAKSSKSMQLAPRRSETQLRSSPISSPRNPATPPHPNNKSKMQSIVVKWVDDKGYGFLKNPQGGKDIFVHRSQVIGKKRELNLGDKVVFEVEETPRGLAAIQVARL